MTTTTKWFALPFLIVGQLPYWMMAELGATVTIWHRLWGLLVSIVLLCAVWVLDRLISRWKF